MGQAHSNTWDVQDSKVQLTTAAMFTDSAGKRWILATKDLDVETEGALTHRINILFRTPEDRIGVAVQGPCDQNTAKDLKYASSLLSLSLK